jgi:hypothetical protein
MNNINLTGTPTPSPHLMDMDATKADYLSLQGLGGPLKRSKPSDAPPKETGHTPALSADSRKRKNPKKPAPMEPERPT